jgi:plastocyanin
MDILLSLEVLGLAVNCSGMRRRTFLTGIGTASLIGLAGCGGNGGGDGGSPTDGGGDGENTVEMRTDGSEYIFDPMGLFVESGTTVTWVNASGAHSSTAYADGNGGATVTRIPEDAEPWNSETLSEEGATFEHTFDVAGTYDYFCIPHKTLGMLGRIVVDEPGGPAEGSMPPDGDVPESDTIVDQETVGWDEFHG